MQHTHRTLWTLVLALLLVAPAYAQSPAGTVASLQGRADAQRTGQPAWRVLTTGNDVFVGERLRTAEASRLKILMRDDSVITLGPKSELVVDEQVVRDEGSRSRLDTVVGAVRAVVTDRYGKAGASFEMKTPTAVAGVRGTGFVVLVDNDAKRTRVIGLYDTTWVRGAADSRGRHEVRVGPGQMTEVVAGGSPTKPRDLARSELDALIASTSIMPGAAGEPTDTGTPGASGSDGPNTGTGNAGDPATPGPAGGSSMQRPDAVIDQPINQLRNPKGPPAPPPPR